MSGVALAHACSVAEGEVAAPGEISSASEEGEELASDMACTETCAAHCPLDVEPGPAVDLRCAWEPNGAEEPAMIAWDTVAAVSAHAWIDAHLCAGEEDWYRFDVASLDYDHYALHLDLIVAGSSWCGEGCGAPWLPAAPENTVEVEVYDAQTMTLLATQVDERGRIDIGGEGEAYSKDLLVRVLGPTAAATFDYELSMNIRGHDGEDECEC